MKEINLLTLKHQSPRDRGCLGPFSHSPSSLLKVTGTIFFFFLFSVGTIFALSLCLLHNTSVSQTGAFTCVWYHSFYIWCLAFYIWCLAFCSCFQWTPLHHLALRVSGAYPCRSQKTIINRERVLKQLPLSRHKKRQ